MDSIFECLHRRDRRNKTILGRVSKAARRKIFHVTKGHVSCYKLESKDCFSRFIGENCCRCFKYFQRSIVQGQRSILWLIIEMDSLYPFR